MEMFGRNFVSVVGVVFVIFLVDGDFLDMREKEIKVDKLLLELKKFELEKGYNDSKKSLPSLNFHEAKYSIERSKVFHILRKFPKGGNLHLHLRTASNLDFFLKNLTYRDDLYMCKDVVKGSYKTHFFTKGKITTTSCDWTLIKDLRKKEENFDRTLIEIFTLNKKTSNLNLNQLWKHFHGVFSANIGLISYLPVFKDYVYNSLETLYNDNVFYVEFRTSFLQLYDSNNKKYPPEFFMETIIETTKHFQKTHPNFIGSKMILAVSRNSITYIKIILPIFHKYSKKFPNFLIGFDLVSFEDAGPPLSYFTPILSKYPIKYFFHAGETDRYGSTDLNLYDAVNLNTSRIGHGLGLQKHPDLLEVIKRRGIAVEVCPISNQMLEYVGDLRMHPAVELVAGGYPMVVASDDPSAWNASGLSYDWYEVFMGMTSESAGLDVLKRFAWDSIEFSGMEEEEKEIARKLWWKLYEEFLDVVLSEWKVYFM